MSTVDGASGETAEICVGGGLGCVTGLRHGWRGPRDRCRWPRLGLNGSVVLHVSRGSRPELGSEAEFVQLDASLLLPFDDLTGPTVTAAGMLQVQRFIARNGILQQFLVGEEAAFFGEQLGDTEHTGIGSGGRRVVRRDGAVGINHPLIGRSRALRLRTGLQCPARLLGALIGREALLGEKRS